MSSYALYVPAVYFGCFYYVTIKRSPLYAVKGVFWFRFPVNDMGDHRSVCHELPWNPRGLI